MLKQIFLVRHYLVALVANGGTALEPRGAVGRRFGVETQVVVSGFYCEWSTSLARLLNDVQSLCARQVHDVTRHTKTRSCIVHVVSRSKVKLRCTHLYSRQSLQTSSIAFTSISSGRLLKNVS